MMPIKHNPVPQPSPQVRPRPPCERCRKAREAFKRLLPRRKKDS